MISREDQRVLKKLTEKVTQEAKSVHEIINMTIEGLKEIDVFISFDDYPTFFNHNVSNSHNSPISDKYPSNFSRKSGIPTSYPGFRGKFRGKIVSTKNYSFGDLSSVLRFINTESGTTGTNFHISGMFFIYDFVHIEKEYRKNHGFKDISNAYRDIFKSLNDNYLKQFENDLKNDNFNKKIIDIKETLSTYLKTMSKHQLSYRNEFKKNFDSKYSKVPPLPPIQFNNCEDVDVVFKRNFSNNEKIHPELEKHYETLDKIVKEMNDIVINNPEFFI